MMRRVIAPDEIAGVRVMPLRAHSDPRGRFLETYRQEWFPGRPTMVQQNRSDSVAGVLRGLHYHLRQADYWYVAEGTVVAALADVRLRSETRGCVATVELGSMDRGLYIPPGVAHGFYAVTSATMVYLVDGYYDPEDELGVAWDDPDLQVPWPLEGRAPILSGRDQNNPRMSELRTEKLPDWAVFRDE